MTKLVQASNSNPYEGNYNICLKSDPTKVIESRYIKNQAEFQAILDSVIKYNNAQGNQGNLLRILQKA